MAYVTIDSRDINKDIQAWASERVKRYAQEYGVELRGEHKLLLSPEGRDLWPGLRISCSCGWTKLITKQLAQLTTGSAIFHDALKEHVLSFTDPNHYTYYPQHSEGR